MWVQERVRGPLLVCIFRTVGKHACSREGAAGAWVDLIEDAYISWAATSPGGIDVYAGLVVAR